MDKKTGGALYRKYRSRDFSELVGQNHITANLQNALKSGRISHAYLFAGPRGTGKTSAARIFAQAVNQLKPEEALSHLDIIEIDAASNRRIDEIRDLREKVHSAPTSAPYKVYIIDEAHMLTTEAFNALLKTLEEPPAHAIFILATTEPHKLPETIISRTQRFNFRPLSESVIVEQLKKIAKAEKINTEEAALELIAIAADGSMRDGISLLDQLQSLSGPQKLSVAQVSQQLGMANSALLVELASAWSARNVAKLVEIIDVMAAQGINPAQFIEQLADYARRLLRASLSQDGQPESPMSLGDLSTLIKAISELAAPAMRNWLAIESALLEACLKGVENSVELPSAPQIPPPSQPTEAPEAPVAKSKPPKTTKVTPRGKPIKLDEDTWLKVLSHIKSHHNSLYALLNTATPNFEAGKLTLSFKFLFHKRRLEEAKNRALLQQSIEAIAGDQLEVILELSATPAEPKTAAGKSGPDEQAVNSVLEILGGEIVGKNP